ncbi:AAA family ATPase [Vibrio alginolyticus]
MKIKITVKNVQHIKKQEVTFDLSKNGITCIAGKNGVGKTTLIRAIRNLPINSTFQETAAPYIFSQSSSISYVIEGMEEIVFNYNRFIKAIDTRQSIPEDIKGIINVELPIPHGERFKHFKSLSDKDEEIRAHIANTNYSTPNELIRLLNDIYGEDRFRSLKEINLNKSTYYVILRDDDERFYIREDYFSSGEYFVVNLYKQIKQGKKLIVIDEIDISLDAMAQVNLVNSLRKLCRENNTNIIFTTHSLALMKTLKKDEIFYMEISKDGHEIIIHPKSYNYIKSVMYGFSGFDKYILTEDECLKNYMQYLIRNSGINTYFKYEIIYIGGATQVVDLIKRNSESKFFSTEENIIAVLDGDQKGKGYLKEMENIVFLPFTNIEMEVYNQYMEGKIVIDGLREIKNKKESDRAKNLYSQLTKFKHSSSPLMSEPDIYALLQKTNPEGVSKFQEQLIKFLT